MDRTVQEILKEKGYKITNQRKWVLDAFINHEIKHLSAEEIYEYVKKDNPEIGLATVYRTIQLFQDIGILETLNLNDGVVRYELAKNNSEHHHHHLICEKCNRVIEVEGDLLEEVEKKCSDTYDFLITNHVVKFYGICKECRAKNK